MRIAISGGIGAGKSAASEHLMARGFAVIDADDIARRVVEPTGRVFRALRDAFGNAVVDPRGELDRSFLADVIFHDPTALRRVNSLTHGPIGDALGRALDSSSSPVTFVALPLFRSEHRERLHLDRVWTVVAPPELALGRLTTHRAMRPEDAAARIASQESNDARIALADVVIWNDGSVDQLHQRLDDALHEQGLL